MSEPWGRPPQSSAYPQQPGPVPPPPPYGSLPTSPGQPPVRRGGRRGLWIALALGVVVVLGVVGVTVVVVANQFGNNDSAPPQVPPPLAAPPDDPLPARRSVYTTLPPSCKLLSDVTARAIDPAATPRDVGASDTDNHGIKQFSRHCQWNSVTGDYVRFIWVRAHGFADGDPDGGVETVTFNYKQKIPKLAITSNIGKVEGQRVLPNLGNEAHLVYGIDSENCRSAAILARSQNVELEVHYGGCDQKPGQLLPITPIDESTALNGVLTMARDALQQINKT